MTHFRNLSVISILIPLLSACIPTGASQSGTTDTQSGAKHYSGLEHVEISPDVPQQIVNYEGFTVNFNASNRTPNYTAWELLGSNVDGEVPRSDNFWKDPTVKNCPAATDYRHTGYDRGHMFPSAEAKYNDTSMQQCFSMANICPQKHALNSGTWKALEDAERKWARLDSALIIVAGPIYARADTERIGQSGVRVPSVFFKAIIAPYVNEPRGIAFIFPNDRAPGGLRQYVVTIDHLEQLTGYDLFHNLPDSLEQAIESTANLRKWTR